MQWTSHAKADSSRPWILHWSRLVHLHVLPSDLKTKQPVQSLIDAPRLQRFQLGSGYKQMTSTSGLARLEQKRLKCLASELPSRSSTRSVPPTKQSFFADTVPSLVLSVWGNGCRSRHSYSRPHQVHQCLWVLCDKYLVFRAPKKP